MDIVACWFWSSLQTLLGKILQKIIANSYFVEIRHVGPKKSPTKIILYV